MRLVTVAATQMACTASPEENLRRAEALVRRAAGMGAQIILLQELFETPYFCQTERAELYHWALETERNPAVRRLSAVAGELGVVLPVSFYERVNNAAYNSVAMIDADGALLGVYRKSHIPDGPGYEEKFYFNPGDTGFKVWDTRFGKIGVGICWDQWFPEAARCMALMGAELLLYPTAIGSEPHSPQIDSRDHWQRCMVGHAACNLVPVLASNRVGTETQDGSEIRFYGSSFITGPTGEILAQADREEETVITAALELDEIRAQRLEWGLFRDRRPELYGAILTADGTLPFGGRG
ncbi:N-carbamoyl-D-amino acid hydrolase [bioreactor metagenome]|uniref:N-carbamoyl-D-amino acid hydrolase n=1 Tax=bioreactor metagenome TaxID=1076179 RepID=A0A644YC62_9ZZZZ